MPVEVGDAELRAGLEDVRELLGGLGDRAARVRAHARALTRVGGRRATRPSAPLAVSATSMLPRVAFE